MRWERIRTVRGGEKRHGGESRRALSHEVAGCAAAGAETVGGALGNFAKSEAGCNEGASLLHCSHMMI